MWKTVIADAIARSAESPNAARSRATSRSELALERTTAQCAATDTANKHSSAGIIETERVCQGAEARSIGSDAVANRRSSTPEREEAAANGLDATMKRTLVVHAETASP
jgi:hypothetical protein